MLSALKDQRDRFLGFAFANADVLLEVSLSSFTILFSAGAMKGLGDGAVSSLKGSAFLDLFAPRDHALIKALKQKYCPGKRFGPIVVNLKVRSDDKENRSALLSGISLPENPDILYFTLSKAHLNLAQDEGKEHQQEELLAPDQFADAARKAIQAGQASGTPLGMTLIDLPGSEHLRKKIGAEQWTMLNENISGILRAYSADGKTAAMLDNGRFGVLHEAGISPDQIKKDLEQATIESDPDNIGVSAESHNIELDDGSLSEHEMAKAIVYTINKFASKAGDFDITSLKSGFEDFLGENAQAITQYKTVINQQRFELKFQPIVDLRTADVAYHEVLVRFENGKSPFEAIEFMEDVGLSSELDLAVCGRALNYLLFNAKDKNTKLSVNLSGVSVQDKRFISKLRYKLEPHLKSSIPQQLIFEITESSEITNLDQVNEFIRSLQDDGFKVALDDFGAGSASFQYLQKLHVNAVKIDGQYVMAILESKRDQAMIRNLVHMCKDLDIQVVAERVETKELATLLKSMDVDYAQGYYFAKPLDEPSNIARKPF